MFTKWYERRWAEDFGDDLASQTGLAASIATWTFPLFTAVFMLEDFLSDLFHPPATSGQPPQTQVDVENDSS